MPRTKMYALDIETTSQGKRAKDYTDNKYYEAPKNIKDPEKIKANIEGQKKKAAEGHALKWYLGKVISVALVGVHNDTRKVFYGHDEKKILTELANELGMCKLIGKSSHTFDFPFLVGRYIANKIPVPLVLKHRHHLLEIDTFFGWSMSSGQRGRLAEYAHGAGLDGKLMNGADVPILYNKILMTESTTGDIEEVNKMWKEIADYNLDDADKTAEIAERYYTEEEIYAS